MNPETKLKFKAFLWDQTIRPIYVFINPHQLKLFFLAMIILSALIRLSWLFWISIIGEFVLMIYELVKYYNSGEFMRNYRDNKYPTYRQTIKEIRKQRKDLNSLNNLNNNEEEKENEPAEEI